MRPPNEKGALLHAPISKLQLIKATSSIKAMQGWELEGARLFREFWRTGNQKHVRAFFTHVVAMLAHEIAARQALCRFCRCFQPTLSPAGPAIPEQNRKEVKSEYQ